VCDRCSSGLVLGLPTTVHQAAERLAVSEKTVRREIAAGELPAMQLGGPGSALRIDAGELDRWLYGPPRDSVT
jgi:excisionase family DNA binding protein